MTHEGQLLRSHGVGGVFRAICSINGACVFGVGNLLPYNGDTGDRLYGVRENEYVI